MTNHRDTVSEIMDLFNAEYPLKFSTSPERLKVWAQMLKGFDRELILGAAYHLASTCQWPPPIAQMREQCVLMQHGELQNPTGAESWERIKLKMTSKPDLVLNDMEKKALAQTSTIFDLKRTSNEPTDRAHYIKAFDKLVQKRHVDRITLPEVKALAARNTPALPAPESKQLPQVKDDGGIMSAEDAIKEFGPEIAGLKDVMGKIGEEQNG